MASLRAQFDPIARAAAERYGLRLGPDRFAAQLGLETIGWDADVVYNRRASPKGARGAGQFMPATAAEWGVDVNDPHQSIDGAARYMRWLEGQFDGNVEMALAAYNHGIGNVSNLISKYGSNWRARLPKETKTYLGRIVGDSEAPMTEQDYRRFTGSRAEEAPRQEGGTSDAVARALEQHRRLTGEITDLIASGEPLYTMTTPVIGEAPSKVPTEAGLYYLELLDQRKALTDTIETLGFNPDGTTKRRPGDPDSLSPNTELLAEVDRERIKEGGRQFDEFERRAAEEFGLEQEEEAARLAEATRQNNLNSTLDLLEQSVKRGELSEREATRRLAAATSAANVQVDTLREFGGRNLRPGTTHFPGFEQQSAFAQAVRALTGRGFEGFQTQGTFGLNPAALAGTITQAGNAPGGMAGVDEAIKNATAALAGLGVPRISGPGMPGAVNALTGGV